MNNISHSTHHPAWAGSGLTLMAASLFAFKGILVKLAFAEQITLAVLMLLRFSLATPMFWARFRTWRNARNALQGQSKRDWIFCAAAGLCYFISVYTDFKAISLIPVGIERLLFFSYPIFVLFLSAIIFRAFPTRTQLYALVLMQFGLVLVINAFNSTNIDLTMIWGIGYAFAAAFSYALFLLLAQSVTPSTGSINFTIIANTFTFLAIIIYFFHVHAFDSFQINWSGFSYIFAIALFCTVIPFFMLFEGIRRIGSARAALISTLGPVITVLASCILLDEKMALVQWLGMIIIIVGVFFLEKKQIRKKDGTGPNLGKT